METKTPQAANVSQPSADVKLTPVNTPTYQPGEQYTIELNRVVDSQGNKILGSIVYGQYFKPLYHKMLERWSSIINTHQTVMNGAVVYSIGNVMATSDYAEDGSQIVRQTVDQITVTLDYDKSTFYEVPLPDLARLGVKTEGGVTLSGEMLMNWEENTAKAKARYLYFKTLQLASVTARNRQADPTLMIDVDSGATAPAGIIDLNFPLKNGPLDQWRTAWYQLATIMRMTANMISKKYTGIEPFDFTLLVSPRVATALTMAKMNLGSEGSFLLLKNGEMNDELEINGFKAIIMPFLGTYQPKGSQTDTNEDFDFRDIDMILLHKEALAFPYLDIQHQTMINPLNSNPRTIDIFAVNKLGGAALRPELCIGFKVSFGNLQPDQTVYNSEVAGLINYLAQSANAIVAASGSAIKTPLLAAINGYGGAKTTIDVAKVTAAMVSTLPANAATVTTPTMFNYAISSIPVVADKVATPSPVNSTGFYKNA